MNTPDWYNERIDLMLAEEERILNEYDERGHFDLIDTLARLEEEYGVSEDVRRAAENHNYDLAIRNLEDTDMPEHGEWWDEFQSVVDHMYYLSRGV